MCPCSGNDYLVSRVTMEFSGKRSGVGNYRQIQRNYLNLGECHGLLHPFNHRQTKGEFAFLTQLGKLPT